MMYFLNNVICTIVSIVMIIDVLSVFVPLKFWNRATFGEANMFKLHLAFAVICLVYSSFILALVWAVSCYYEYKKLKAAGIEVWGKN